MKKMTVVRLEGNYVICEDADKKLFALEKNETPKEVSVGTLLAISDEGEITVESNKNQKRVW